MYIHIKRDSVHTYIYVYIYIYILCVPIYIYIYIYIYITGRPILQCLCFFQELTVPAKQQ